MNSDKQTTATMAPGPWRVEDSEWTGATVYSAEGLIVCEIPYGDIGQEEQVRANGLAIAAVPDVIEALRGLYVLECRPAWNVTSEERKTVVNAAREALKKAGCA